MKSYDKNDFIKTQNGEVWCIEEIHNQYVYIFNVHTKEKDYMTTRTLDWLILNGHIDIYCADYEW